MKKLLFFFSLSLIISLAFVFTACETQSAGGSSISVSPADSTIGINQSVTLSAAGGEVYTWTLGDPNIGYLSCGNGGNGGVVTYTATSGVGSNQYITVSSTTEKTTSSSGSYYSGSSTNEPVTTVSSASATAVVHHR